MAAVHIRNVSEDAVGILKERAAARGTSLEAILRELIETEALRPVTRRRGQPLRFPPVRTGNIHTWSREDLYGDDER